jgi:hypothetical protein
VVPGKGLLSLRRVLIRYVSPSQVCHRHKYVTVTRTGISALYIPADNNAIVSTGMYIDIVNILCSNLPYLIKVTL